MAQVTLYLPEGGVEDYPNAQEVGIEEGFLTFVNQLDAPDSKAMRFKTSLPFVWKQAGGRDPGDQFKPR
jgi:hypothetical protein